MVDLRVPGIMLEAEAVVVNTMDKFSGASILVGAAENKQMNI